MHFYLQGNLPEPPYYAVIFSSEKSSFLDGFEEMDRKTLEVAKEISGFLGFETAGNGKENIFISYWKSMESLEEWKKHPLHLAAKQKGTQLWYTRYLSQICLVEKSHLFN